MFVSTKFVGVLFAAMMFTGLFVSVVGAIPMSFESETGNPVFRGCEPSLIMSDNGTWVDCWYSGGSSFQLLYYTNASINTLSWWTPPGVVVLSGIRFPTVVKDDGVYYLFASKDPAGQDDVWLWSSTNKLDWTPMNGGLPILYQTADGDSQWHSIWNTGVVVIAHVFHMFVECATHDGAVGQNGVRLGYTHGTMDSLGDFMVYRTQRNVIDKGGSPCPVYVPDRNAIMLFYATLNTTWGSWHLSMATASLSSDLSDSSSWDISDRFKVADYNNGADPAFCEVGSAGEHNLIFLWFHGQPVFNDVYEEYSDATLNEFYDSWGAPYVYRSGPGVIMTLLPFMMACMLALTVSVVSDRAFSMSMFVVVLAMMLCVLAAINVVPVYTLGLAGMLYVVVLYMYGRGGDI